MKETWKNKDKHRKARRPTRTPKSGYLKVPKITRILSQTVTATQNHRTLELSLPATWSESL